MPQVNGGDDGLSDHQPNDDVNVYGWQDIQETQEETRQEIKEYKIRLQETEEKLGAADKKIEELTMKVEAAA